MDHKKKAVLLVAALLFACSTLFFLKAKPVFALADLWINEKELGQLCVEQMVPTAGLQKAADDAEISTVTKEDNGGEAIADEDIKLIEDAPGEEAVPATQDPLVIIYHTHSSESYMPFAESNYHREAEEGTVRDVATVLEKELEKKGIQVLHDKTVHDRPSYNESYSRSLSTIQTLIKENPSAVYIIDLHRDAAAASATEGKYLEIDGERVAKFSIVVGKANENYAELYAFAKRISQKAEELYPGYGGPIIEKEYNYNGFVSNNAILLEVGNNKNTIEESRACGKHFAQVLAAIIAEGQ